MIPRAFKDAAKASDRLGVMASSPASGEEESASVAGSCDWVSRYTFDDSEKTGRDEDENSTEQSVQTVDYVTYTRSEEGSEG